MCYGSITYFNPWWRITWIPMYLIYGKPHQYTSIWRLETCTWFLLMHKIVIITEESGVVHTCKLRMQYCLIYTYSIKCTPYCCFPSNNYVISKENGIYSNYQFTMLLFLTTHMGTVSPIILRKHQSIKFVLVLSGPLSTTWAMRRALFARFVCPGDHGGRTSIHFFKNSLLDICRELPRFPYNVL